MDGSRYPDGVLVTSQALTRTETSKSTQIVQNRLINWETGVFDGGDVTVNPINQNRVDISTIRGISPNGELVVVPPLSGPGSAGALNVALADTSLGALNFVYAFYVELGDQPMPHETNGRTYATQTVASFQIAVLTLAQFQALPVTDPTYVQLARDRGLLLAIVTGTGGNLTQGSIEQTVPWRTLKYATQGTPVLPGVTITAVSDDTPEGETGALVFTIPGSGQLEWQAPTEAGPGPPVSVPAEGFYTLTALGGSTIRVYVVITALPTAAQNAQVTITGIYSQRVPRESNTDRHHRSLVGSGIPTPQNPHGLSIDDIAPGFVDELTRHQELEHANGIWRGSSTTCLRPTVAENAGIDAVNIQAPTGVDTYYVFGKRLTSIVNTVVTFTDLVPTETQKQVYTIYVDVSGNVKKSKRASFQSALPTITGIENNFIYFSDNIVAGTYNLTYVSAGAGLGGTLSWDGGPEITVPATISSLTGALFRLRNGFQEAWFFIGNPGLILGQLAGTYVDAIDVFDLVDVDENLQLGQVSWSGSGSGDLGYTPNRGAVAARMVDTRLFGTLRDFHLRDDTLVDKLEVPLAEHSPDGVVVGQVDFFDQRGSLFVVPAGGLLVNILGFAPVYVRGRRLSVAGTTNVLLPDNASTIIYVNQDGLFLQTSATALPAFLSPAKGIWRVDLETHAPYGAALALVTTAGGLVTDVIDLRRNLSGGNVTIVPWSVGSARQGAVDILGEFLDLRGAALYAAYSSRIPTLQLLDVTLEEPVTFAGPVVLSGGVLRLGVGLFSSNPAAAITFSLSPFSSLDTQVVLRDVQVYGEAGLVGSTASALVRQSYAGQVLLDGCFIDLTVSLHSVVRVGVSAGSARIIRTTVRTNIGGQGPVVHFDAAGTFEAENVVLLDSTAMAALVRVAASFAVVAQVRGVSGFSQTPLSSLGAGSQLTDSLFDGVQALLLPAGSGSHVRCQFRNISMPGGTLAGLTDVLIENSVFSSGLTLTSPTRTRVVQTRLTSGQFMVDGGTDIWLEQVTTTDNLRVEGTVVSLLVRQCRFSGSSKGIYCGAAGSFSITNFWVDESVFELFEVISSGQVLLKNIWLTGCTFDSADITPTATDVLEHLRVQGCRIGVHVFVSNPGSFLPQSKADVCVFDNVFDPGGTPSAQVKIQVLWVAAAVTTVHVRGNVFRGNASSGENGAILFGSGTATSQAPPVRVVFEENLLVLEGDSTVLPGIADFGAPVVCLHGGIRVARVSKNRFFFHDIAAHALAILAAGGPTQCHVTENTLEFPTGSPVQWILPSTTVPAAHLVALFITVADLPLQTPNETGYTFAGPQLNTMVKDNAVWAVSYAAINADDFVLAQLAAQAAGPQATIQVIGNSSGANSNIIVPAGATTAQNT